MRRSPVELCASVMAAVSQAASSRVLEKCGLEQILEALKLLLSPGGERTEFGAGLHWGLWAGSVQRHFTLEETEVQGGMGTAEYLY